QLWAVGPGRALRPAADRHDGPDRGRAGHRRGGAGRGGIGTCRICYLPRAPDDGSSHCRDRREDAYRAMFTVRDALELEVLRQAHLVAGTQGLDREVRWAHVVDVPDVPQWVRAGDLLLTTGVSWGDRAESRDRLVPALYEQDLAGMILAVGDYLAHAPREMIAQADQLAFPLIELPWDVPFEDVVLAVSECIINAQTRMLRR